jgi:hypothetical protein
MEHLNVTTEILDVDEARRRLAAVKPDVRELMDIAAEIRTVYEEAGGIEKDDPRRVALRERLEGLEARARPVLRRINEQGGYVKDGESGLLDFYSWRDGELVFLCWRHGEETITHWHGLNEGFGGRKPLDPA